MFTKILFNCSRDSHAVQDLMTRVKTEIILFYIWDPEKAIRRK